MSEVIDARGLSCPQPVLVTLEKIQSMASGEMLVKVDTEASKENVIRAAGSKGWDLKNLVEEDGEYHMTLAKG